jgi:hypothetical protein
VAQPELSVRRPNYEETKVAMTIESKRLKELLAKATSQGLGIWAPALVELENCAPALAREVLCLRADKAKMMEAVEKVKAGYVSRMKFCDIEPLPYYRDFVAQLTAINATTEQK